MTAYDLTEVHQASLSILREIDRICRKYNIRYAMDSGTLLGAARHQGFIPWDDDADVSFTREQYQLFIKVAGRELPPNMLLLTPEDFCGGRRFYDFCARILYLNSQIHEESEQVQYYEGKLNHLYVDLFVIDRLPRHKAGQKGVLLLQTVIYGLAMGHRYRLDYEKYQGFQKVAVKCLAGVGRLVPMKLLFALQRKVSTLSQKGRGRLYYYSNYAPDYYHVILEKDWCSQTVEMEFEGESLMAPKGWRQVLKLVYGDYMQMPPPDKQAPTHASSQIRLFCDEVNR